MTANTDEDYGILPSSAIFWNADGVIACFDHVPEPDSTKWADEEWEPMPDEFTDCRPSDVCEVCIAFDSIEAIPDVFNEAYEYDDIEPEQELKARVTPFTER